MNNEEHFRFMLIIACCLGIYACLQWICALRLAYHLDEENDDLRVENIKLHAILSVRSTPHFPLDP
jgi:hypothetical protein